MTDPFAAAELAAHVQSLYGDPRLIPLLRQLIHASCRVTQAAGGSISIIDQHRGRYTKVAESGPVCRMGATFPLDEGVTGQVVRERQPVVVDSHGTIGIDHPAAGLPSPDETVAAIPIWWRGEVVGVNVVFAGRPRHFTAEEVDQLEALTQLASPGFATAVRRELALSYSRPRERDDDDSAARGTAAAVQMLGMRPLSQRERQVATLLARGLNDRAVAERLLISPKTVEKHVSRLLRKTGTTTRTGAVARAMALGWLDDVLHGPAS